MDLFINSLTESIEQHKEFLSNTGTRPLISHIQEKSQQIINYYSDPTQECGLIALIAPDLYLSTLYFKGWKVKDFERLIIELQNLSP
jgi:hypothetical protein